MRALREREVVGDLIDVLIERVPLGKPLGTGRDVGSTSVAADEDQWDGVGERALVPDTLVSQKQLVRIVARDGAGPFRLGGVGPGAKVEIGRASCKGKSVDLGGRRIIKKKKCKSETE